MFNNYKEFEQAIYDYLCDIIKGYGGFPDYYAEFQQDTMIVIETCVAEEYICGVETWKDANGASHVSHIGNVYLTLKGYQFINEFEDNTPLKISKRAERRAKISTVIAVIALLLSFATVLVEIASNHENIMEFIKLFFGNNI